MRAKRCHDVVEPRVVVSNADGCGWVVMVWLLCNQKGAVRIAGAIQYTCVDDVAECVFDARVYHFDDEACIVCWILLYADIGVLAEWGFVACDVSDKYVVVRISSVSRFVAVKRLDTSTYDGCGFGVGDDSTKVC